MAKSKNEYYVNNLYSFYSSSAKNLAASAVAPSAIGAGAAIWLSQKIADTYEKKLTEKEILVLSTAILVASIPLSIPTIGIALFVALPIIAPVIAAVGPYFAADEDMLTNWMEP